MKIKTFRGKLKDGQVERIRLSTNQGLKGYRIVKFQIMADRPGLDSYELVARLTTQYQDATGAINFDDPLLLGVAYLAGAANSINYPTSGGVIFDHVKFNQDIYIGALDVNGSEHTNYYVELEQVTLDVNEATVATLKDMRGRE
tara:strand:- start:128 stop:559 length:432 start_codon:yes stop_codon:yes gene_type:complete